MSRWFPFLFFSACFLYGYTHYPSSTCADFQCKFVETSALWLLGICTLIGLVQGILSCGQKKY